MIETLKPPTDSLYKFLSIIGLVFFLTSVVTPIVINRQLNNEAAEVIRDYETGNIDAETHENTWKRVEKQGARVREAHEKLKEAVAPNSKTSQPEKMRMLEQAKTISDDQDQLMALYQKQINDWLKQNAHVEYKRSLLDDTETYAKRMFNLCVVAAPIGLVMSIIGFVLWYKRAQKFEDLVLKKKVESEPTESRIIIP